MEQPTEARRTALEEAGRAVRAGHDLGDRLWGPLDVAGDDDLDSDFNAWAMGWPNEGG